MNNGQASILIPAKFISITLHIVVTSCILANYRENIYSANILESDSQWDTAKANVVGAMITTLIFCSVEIIILFLGINMYCHRLNMVQTMAHMIGVFLYSFYTLDSWIYDQIWSPWVFFSLLPLIIECYNAMSSYFFYRRFKA